MNDIHYWNRDNFEGLASLAEALRADPRLEELAAYCELREKGLRREAFARLEAFIDQIQSLQLAVQRQLALRILEAHWKTPSAHQFLTKPLRTRFVEPVLEEWRAADAEDAVPLRYLALLRRDHDLLEEALRVDPQDDHVRVTLAGLLIGLVDYQAHHLVEGVFLGNEAEALADFARAASLLAGATDPISVRALQQDLDELAALLRDWEEYRQTPDGTFPDWCRTRGLHRRWWSIHDYGRGAVEGRVDAADMRSDDSGPGTID